MVVTGFAYNYTVVKLIESVDQTNTYYDYMSKLILVIWIVALAMVGIYLWFFYLKNMMMSIWRT